MKSITIDIEEKDIAPLLALLSNEMKHPLNPDDRKTTEAISRLYQNIYLTANKPNARAIADVSGGDVKDNYNPLESTAEEKLSLINQHPKVASVAIEFWALTDTLGKVGDSRWEAYMGYLKKQFESKIGEDRG